MIIIIKYIHFYDSLSKTLEVVDFYEYKLNINKRGNYFS